MAITALGYRLLKFLHCTCTVCLKSLRFLLGRVSTGFDEYMTFSKKTYVMYLCLYEEVGFRLGISSQFFHL